MQAFHKHADFFLCLLLALFVLTGTLPFIHHAYHIDEPLFLKIASQIKLHPFHPYDFQYLWGRDLEPMHKIAAFPPLFAYLLAGLTFSSQFPSEAFTHFCLIPFALLSAFSFYVLARLLKFAPLQAFIATSLFIASPVFIISANLAMPDMAAVAFLLTSLCFVVKASQTQKNYLFILGGILLGVSILTRYNTFPFLLAVFFISLSSSHWKKALLPCLIALLMYLSWNTSQLSNGGEEHLASTVKTFLIFSKIPMHFVAFNLAFLFSTFLPFIFLIFQAFPNKSFRFQFNQPTEFSLFILAGFLSVLIPFFYIHFASKYLLWIQPFILLLILKDFHTYSKKYIYWFFCFFPIVFAFSLLIAASDFQLANTYKNAAKSIFEEYKLKNPSSKIWFTGHWGWQYYLEKEGATPLPFSSSNLMPNDLILVPTYASPQPIHPSIDSKLKNIGRYEYTSYLPFLTMNSKAGAGFYSDAWGFFPYVISKEALEVFKVFEVNP